MIPEPAPLLPRELQLSAAAVLLALLGWVVFLIRRRRLSVRESLLWFLSTSAALAVTLFPETLRWFAHRVHVEVPANALFALAFLYVLVNLLAATLTLSKNAEQLRRIAQECALLRAEIDELRSRLPATPPSTVEAPR